MEMVTTPALADLVRAGRSALIEHYGERLHRHHLQALNAIQACRTGACGEIHHHCVDCGHAHHQALSCGHRNCPQCQAHTTAAWLERQRAKRLPVDYFMVTFTLPEALRGMAWQQPRTVYDALFASAASTLQSFGLNSRLSIELGLCAVLHTHNRRLDFHPHLHVIVPGGGLHRRRRQWKKLRGRYLFNAFALAKVFRARMLATLAQAGIALPADDLPAKWVVHCTNVGTGENALQYLSRYLYRGVIAPSNLVAYDPQTRTVTFRYRDGRTRQSAYRTQPIADFLWRIVIHVLPPGFRRTRDYGFLHGNARLTLIVVQLLLHVTAGAPPPPPRPVSMISGRPSRRHFRPAQGRARPLSSRSTTPGPCSIGDLVTFAL